MGRGHILVGHLIPPPRLGIAHLQQVLSVSVLVGSFLSSDGYFPALHTGVVCVGGGRDGPCRMLWRSPLLQGCQTSDLNRKTDYFFLDRTSRFFGS